MFALCLALALCAASALAQASDRARVDDLPIRPPAEDGVRLTVVDWDSLEPVAGVDVVVVPRSLSEEQQVRGRELDALRLEGDAFRRAFAAEFGSRYRTGDEGAVVVPRIEGPVSILAIRGEVESYRALVRLGDPLEIALGGPRFIEARVVDQKGNPAKGVTIRAESDGRRGLSAMSDADGLARIPLHDQPMARRVSTHRVSTWTVRPLVIGTEAAGVVVDKPSAARPSVPVEVVLPPCGTVQYRFYDAEEKPSARVEEVRIGLGPFGMERSREQVAVEDGSVTFYPVALGRRFKATARVEGLASLFVSEHGGPQFDGEFALFAARLNASAPVLRFRVLDAEGRPVADELVGMVVHGPERSDFLCAETDGGGALLVPLSPFVGQFEGEVATTIHVHRRAEGPVTSYRGAATATLPLEDGAVPDGIHDLGDLRLETEPVFVSGRVVTPDGEPIAGAKVMARLTVASRGGGRTTIGYWFNEHCVRTDAEGRFELRELDPAEVRVSLTAEAEGWQQHGAAPAANTGETGVEIVLHRSVVVSGSAAPALGGVPASVSFRVDGEVVGRPRGARLADDGTFRIEGVAAGRYDVSLTCGAGRIDWSGVEITGEAPEELQAIDWRAHFRLVDIETVDAEGAPIRAVLRCRVGEREFDLRRRTFSLPSGAERTAVPLEGATIVAAADGYLARSVPVDGGTVRIAMVAAPTIAVELASSARLPERTRLEVMLFRRGPPSFSGSWRVRGEDVEPVPFDGRASLPAKASGTWSIALLPAATMAESIPGAGQRELMRPLWVQTVEVPANGDPVDPVVMDIDRSGLDILEALLEAAKEP